MTKFKFHKARKVAGTALALSLGLALAGCGGMPGNRTLESVHQPVVERTNFTLDLTTGPGGLSLPEARRLDGWFQAMDLRYGDRISIDDPLESGATLGAVEEVAGRYGLLVSTEAPVTPGYVNAGSVRVVVTRATARVPGCPDWSAKSDANYKNATSTNYGCATNATMAAMIANPEDLIRGSTDRGDTTAASAAKAIDTYRNAAPTGQGGLKATSTSSGK